MSPTRHLIPLLGSLLALHLPSTLCAPSATELFRDDFDVKFAQKPHLPDPVKWTIDVGPSTGLNETQTFTDSQDNIYVGDSTLRITPLKTSGKWTSARIESRPSQDFTVGPGQKVRIEARVKFGAAAPTSQMGIWGAFSVVSAAQRGKEFGLDGGAPGAEGVGIFETMNGNTEVRSKIFCGANQLCPGPHGLNHAHNATAFRRGKWSIVALEIDRAGDYSKREQSLEWFTDGMSTQKFGGWQLQDEKAWNSLVSGPKMLVLGVAVGGVHPYLTPNADTVGGADAGMEVDYVVVSKIGEK